jgi:3-oxoacyl-(acyl-carrier-protein) synthase
VFAELTGVGVSQDPADMRRAKASAATARRAVQEAADGIRPDFVVAHGIGTRADDRDEAAILAEIGIGAPPVTALKGLTGYLGAATAAVELSIGILAARGRSVPPVAGLAAPDEPCPLDLVVGRPRPLDAPQPSFVALSWSWSGQCAAVAARALPA